MGELKLHAASTWYEIFCQEAIPRLRRVSQRIASALQSRVPINSYLEFTALHVSHETAAVSHEHVAADVEIKILAAAIYAY